MVFALRCTVISPNATPGLAGHYTETGARKHSHAPSLMRFDIFRELKQQAVQSKRDFDLKDCVRRIELCALLC